MTHIFLTHLRCDAGCGFAGTFAEVAAHERATGPLACSGLGGGALAATVRPPLSYTHLKLSRVMMLLRRTFTMHAAAHLCIVLGPPLLVGGP